MLLFKSNTAAEILPRPTDAFAADVMIGLTQKHKTLPSRYLYDSRGSAFFSRITQLDEYYLTRCELEILQRCSSEMAALLGPGPVQLVELGAGSSDKAEIVIRAFLEQGLDVRYVPVDICEEAVENSIGSLQRLFPQLKNRIQGMVAEYFEVFELLAHHSSRIVVLFLGSNIGNLDPEQTSEFLRKLRRPLKKDDGVLIGFDLKKDFGILARAYKDSFGITRDFTLNLLDRINRELGANFDRNHFMHHSFYNPFENRVESWLVSGKKQTVFVELLDTAFLFQPWEGIHIENSYKYDLETIHALAENAGFDPSAEFFDRQAYFVDSLWKVR